MNSGPQAKARLSLTSLWAVEAVNLELRRRRRNNCPSLLKQEMYVGDWGRMLRTGVHGVTVPWGGLSEPWMTRAIGRH